MKLFLLCLNIYLVSGNFDVEKKMDTYEHCFTLPPKTVNGNQNIESHPCPNGYTKYQEYQNIIPNKDYTLLKNDDCNINQVSKFGDNSIIKIYGVCCKIKN
jgi:hypothetical protein